MSDSPLETPRLGATAPGERLVALDLLRGVALFGVCAVNLLHFALTTDHAVGLAADAPLRELLAWALVTGLLTGKSFPLFSLLFGMGFALQMERTESAGRAFLPVYRRRLLSLAALGLLHGVLLFSGDILFVYACCGGLLLLVRHAPPRALWQGALIVLAVGSVLSLLVHASVDMLEQDPLWNARELVAYGEGPLSETLAVNAIGYGGWLLISTLISFNWRVLACFLAGAALMRTGLLGREHAALQRRGWRTGLALGLPLEAAALVLQRVLPDAPLAGVLFEELGSAFLTLAWLSGIVLLAHSSRVRGFVRAAAATGRMALTNYLGQSLIACLLFRWYGLDLFERLGRAELLGIAVLIWSAQTLFSLLWLARFPMGPLESLWRRITYAGTLGRP